MADTGEFSEAQRLAKHRRIRLVKRLMRPLPRRATVHRYPILKYFANTARNRSYLWEFKSPYIISAIWIGWIIALIPMYGLQMVAAFLLCIPFRGNALIAMLLQWITNPLTIAPIVYGQYKLGEWLALKMGMEPLDMDFAQIVSENGILEVLRTLSDGGVIFHIAASCLLGGFIISIAGAALTTALYLSRRKAPKA
ncbi:MAG: DUF2062 domain-containing protein [Opitutales bacterium]|nr:DUF2062 domain-containing protein [Opitutales bacterium]